MKRIVAAALLLAFVATLPRDVAFGQPAPGWKHSGQFVILTTPEGANLAAGAVVEQFPLLVRLHRDWFDFSQAEPGGEDIRFFDSRGRALAYEVEQWDPAAGAACIWVRMPRIEGNSRQPVVMHWGNPAAVSESRGGAVFNDSNGYLSVWHMDAAARDATGTLTAEDKGTTAAPGVIGDARHLAGQQGICGGEQIDHYPTGAEPHTTQLWFKAERPNGTLIGWGNEHAQGKVVMQYRSPPHVRMDCYFSGANVEGRVRIPPDQWTHVAYVHRQGDARVYVNGVLDSQSTDRGAPLALRRPLRLWLGGWYGHYDFVGTIDEARVSRVARSADWIRLEHENQKSLQTLVGPLVQPGDEFSVSPAVATVAEGKSVELAARAGGAQKIVWSLVRDGAETPLAVDRLKYTFAADRVSGDSTATLRIKAVYPDGVKTKDVPIAVREDIPEPEFTLDSPKTWDGRTPIEVVPHIKNLAAMREKGGGSIRVQWDVGPMAVIKRPTPERLFLRRALNGGAMLVTATVDNGGRPARQSVAIKVAEPQQDPWIARVPEKDEKPVPGQFIPRDDGNEGTLFYNGTLAAPADRVFLKVFADDKLLREETAVPTDRSYAFAVKLKAGLIKYRVVFGTRTDGRETVLDTVGDLVCGDVFLVTGQSNAVATDWGKGDPPDFHSPWIRTFGSMSGSPDGERIWGEASYRREGERLQIGYWPMELARRLVDDQKMPICILNGAVGGTRIDQHQRNPANPEDRTTIYGRLLWRARQARVTHGVRALLWYQGENDQGADGPTGGFGWETYRPYFLELAAAWKDDFPNIQHYYVFQIWPRACAMGVDGSDNRLREVQRNLPTAFSHLSVMSTLGVDPPGGCHYPMAGYAELARLIAPLVERDHYGKRFAQAIAPPNLVRAARASAIPDTITLEFDQPIRWDDALAGQFYLDGEKDAVASGRAVGNVLTLRLKAPLRARTITYLDSRQWSQKTLLRGENGLAALTFCEVPIEAGTR